MSDIDPKSARADAKAATARAKALRPWWKRKRIMIPLVFVAVIAIAAAAGGGGDDSTDDRSEIADSDAGQSSDDGRSQHYVVGDTATSSDLDITIHEVTDPFIPTNGLVGPTDGQRYVAVDMTVTNTSDEASAFSTLLGLELFDTENKAWNVTITADNLPSVDGALQPSESRRGTAVFELPVDAQLSHLIIKGSITATGSRFDLG